MGSKVTVHPIQAQRLKHLAMLKADMERKRDEYGEAVDRYVHAKIQTERDK